MSIADGACRSHLLVVWCLCCLLERNVDINSPLMGGEEDGWMNGGVVLIGNERTKKTVTRSVTSREQGKTCSIVLMKESG